MRARTRRHVFLRYAVSVSIYRGRFRCSLNTNIICYLLALFILLIIFAYALGIPPHRRALERQLRFYIFFPPLYLYLIFFSLFLPFCLFVPPRSLISLAIWYSARLAISSDIAPPRLHAGSPPADWLCQTFAGPLESASSKFSIRATFLRRFR